MSSQPAEPRIIRFGLFEVDPAAGQVRKQDRAVRLQDQPFQVLLLLLTRAGNVVTRDELQRAVWPADTFVEFDQGLNTAIKKIRAALGDSADNPRFIETIPRRGYRFIAPVAATVAPIAADISTIAEPSDGRVIEAARPAGVWARPPVWIAAATALLLFTAGVIIWTLQREAEPDRTYKPMPLTSYPGDEFNPTFSPDGTQVAFSGKPPGRGHTDVYVKLVGANESLRLTNASTGSYCPAWSPDGRSIAFMRHVSQGRAGIFLIAPIGGPERRIADVEITETVPCIAWDPSSKWLVVPDRDPATQARGLFVVSADNGEKRRLTSPPTPSRVDADPAISPDGRALVFRRAGELFLLQLSAGLTATGEPRQITFEKNYSMSPAWTPDGRAIVACVGAPHSPALYRIAFSWPGWRPGKPQLLAFAGQGVRMPAISRQGRLAYAIYMIDANIWRLDLSGGTALHAPGVRLIASTRLEHTPQYSPDGRKIAFASNRSGTHQIWICDADGSNARQLTSVQEPYTADPRWSPDGRQLLFHSHGGGKWHSYTISAEGGRARDLNAGELSAQSWSHDGKWLYLNGKGHIWKMASDGGSPVQVTRNGGDPVLESVDGRLLYYTKPSPERVTAALWSVPVEGGPETQVLSSIGAQFFEVVENGIYFFAKQESGPLQFFDFRTKHVVKIADIPGLVAWGLSVSPDRRSLLYSKYEESGSDLWMVENFH